MTDQLNLFEAKASQETAELETPPLLKAEISADQPPLPPAPTRLLTTFLPADYAARRYLEYAMSVVTGRALPSATDGQNPSNGEFFTPCTDRAP